MSEVWRVRLGRQAESDFREILQWTRRSFGEIQAREYAETITLAIAALGAGPDVVGARVRDELGHGVCTLHVARLGRRGRHFVVFRPHGDHRIEVIRVLHDSMDLPRHVPNKIG